MKTEADFLCDLDRFFRSPNAWTPRNINDMIRACISYKFSFWDLAGEKIGDFGIQDLIRILESTNVQH